MLRGTSLAVLLCALAVGVQAQTYYLMSEMTNGVSGVPWPFNPCPSGTIYPQGNGRFFVDDRNSVVSFSQSGSTMTTEELSPPPPPGGGTNGTSTNYWVVSRIDSSFLTNGSLWIEAYSNDTQNIYLQAHNTTNTELYQVFATTNLASVFQDWVPGQFQQGDSSTNVTKFLIPIPMTNGQTFFRGQQGDIVIIASWGQDAYETNATLGIDGQVGRIDFEAVPNTAHDLMVHYTVGGSARNGIDYTNLSGAVIIPAYQGSASVYVQPVGPNTLTNPVESAVFTVEPSTNYLVSPNNSIPVLIKSSSTAISINPTGTNAVRPAAAGLPGQDGGFTFYRFDDLYSFPPVTFYYQITGTASNGVDYQLLSGSLTFGQDVSNTNLIIAPLAESPLQGAKTLTITILSTNGYVADSNNLSCTINIYDQTNAVGICTINYAVNSNGPPGEPAQEGWFELCRNEPHGFLPEMTVNYSLSGEASNSVDYAFLNGTVTFSNGQSSVFVPIDPLSSWTNASKTVVMTLLPGDYLIDTNGIYISGVPAMTNYIQNSSTKITATAGQDAMGPSHTNSAQPGYFIISRDDSRHDYDPLSVNYTLSGSATNGVDYTNLNGIVTFAPDARQTNIYVEPILNTNYPGDKTVKISVPPTTYYYINTNVDDSESVMLILDNNIVFQSVTTNLNSPQGLAYDPYTTNLIVSVGPPYNFEALGTNITQIGGNTVTNLVTTNWSGVDGLSDEVYMAIATNSNSGFTNGDMFFGARTGVGWLSSNAAVSNLNWCALTNATTTNAASLRGGICFDTTGAFSNNLIAVGVNGQVWEVDSQAHSTFLTQLTNINLIEGVAVVPANFGPWSKQIITGDEGTGAIYLIDTNETVTVTNATALFRGGVSSESITVIPENQSLYLLDGRYTLNKLPASYFKNYTGDLLIHDGGEGGSTPELLIVHWDAPSTNFVVRRIRCTVGNAEDAKFAPIELPAH